MKPKKKNKKKDKGNKGEKGRTTGSTDKGGEGEVEASLSHLHRLWRRLAQLDSEASVVARRLAPGELLLREVSLQGQRLRHFGLFGAHSDLDHVVTLCLQQLQQLQQRRPLPPPPPQQQQQLGRTGAPAAAPQPTGGELPVRSEPVAPAEMGAEAGAIEATPKATPTHAAEGARDEAGGPPDPTAAAAPLGALEKLQWLSSELLLLDDAATMDVAVLDQDEYQINSLCVRGHTLQSFSNVTAYTDIAAILAVCTNIVSGGECCPAPAPVLSDSTSGG